MERSRTTRAVRHERLEDLVHEELQKLVDRDVAQELDRQLVDDAQRLDELARAARPGACGSVSVGLRSSSAEAFRIVLSSASSPADLVDPHPGRGLGLDLERDAADRDPVARTSAAGRDEPLAVQERPVARAQVLDRQAAVAVPDDPGVLAGEHLVGDRAGRSWRNARSS